VTVILDLVLGIVTSIGGFVEVGSISTSAQAGSEFGFELLWAIAAATAIQKSDAIAMTLTMTMLQVACSDERGVSVTVHRIRFKVSSEFFRRLGSDGRVS